MDPTPNSSREEWIHDPSTDIWLIFSKDDYDIGRTDAIKHHIPLIPGAQPIKQDPYRQGAMKEAEIERQVQLLKEHDLIEVGTWPYSAPIDLVKKKYVKWTISWTHWEAASGSQPWIWLQVTGR